MEPMLAGTDMAIQTYHTVEPYVTETVWIGKMNRMRERIAQTPENLRAIEKIVQLQSDHEIWALVNILAHQPKIRWKDSIKQVCEEAPNV